MSDFQGRVGKARQIALVPRAIEGLSAHIFSVPSQSGKGVYLVSDESGRWKCICPDFVAHQMPCKHVLAVRLKIEGVPQTQLADAEKTRPRLSYKQSWHAYNEGQKAELRIFDEILADLVDDVRDPSPANHTGRPRIPLDDLLYCAVQKVYYQVSLRRSYSLFVRAQERDVISAVPSPSMISVVLQREDITPILHDLIAKSALALASLEENFAVDSSGFRTTSFGDYCREKYGAPSHNVWLKAHIIVGTRTHVIPRVVVTGGHAADAPQFASLVEGTVAAGFVMKEVYADKGYLARANYDVVDKAGATPYIMFKKDSRGRVKGRGKYSHAWKQMWHLFQTDPTKYLDRYHKRENVEAVFAAIKKKLGETLKSKDPTARVNELLCKVLAYNLTVLVHEMFENGISFPGESADKKSVSTVIRAGSEPPPELDHPTDIPGPAFEWDGRNN